MTLRSLMILLIFAVSPAFTSAASALDDNERVNYFTISKNVKRDVDTTIEKAKNNNSLALIIMGANWCHDTRSLMESLDDPAMKTTLEGYETTLVNMDQYTDALAIAKSYGQATVFETPTVMIIDPKTNTLVNSHSMHQWRSAYNMTLEEKVAYFEKMKDPANHSPQTVSSNIPLLRLVLGDIDTFEAKHAARIEAVYGTFISYVEDNKEARPDNFNDIWGELWGLRSTLTDDVARLRREAAEQVSAGKTRVALTYPKYEKFSWE